MPVRRAVPATTAAAFTLTAVALVGPPVTTSTWSLGGDGDWSVDTNWSPPVVPNNDLAGVFDVVIDGALSDVVVTLDVSRTIETLRVDAGDALIMPNSIDLTIAGGSIVNDGLIEVASTGSLNQLRMSSDTLLTGAGTVRLAPAATARFEASAVGVRLTNAAGHLIAGGGSLGLNSLALTNQGTVDADAPGAVMQIDGPTGFLNLNPGQMRASGGGILQFAASDWDHTGGTVEAESGSTVALGSNTTHVGGTFTTAGDGLIRLEGTARLDGAVLDGDVRVGSGADPFLAGSLTNFGTLTWETVGSLSQVRIDGDLVLDGGGTFDLGPGSGSRLEAAAAGDRLTNEDNLIRGGGAVGLNSLAITNRAEIRADDPALDLTIDPPTTGDLTNEGLLLATGGARMAFVAGMVDNALGVVRADDASEVLVQSTVTIAGGRLETAGDGVITLSGNPTLDSVELDGRVEVANAADPLLSGSLTNRGTLTWLSAGSTSQVRTTGDLVLDGGGTLDLGAGTGNRLETTVTGSRLVNEDSVIRGGGRVGLNSLAVTNRGLLLGDRTEVTLELDPPTTGDFTNESEIRAADGGTVRLLAGLYLNDGGVIRAADASTIEVVGPAEVVGGELRADAGGVVTISVAPRLEDVTLDGEVAIASASDPIIRGQIDNRGVLRFLGTGSFSQLRIDGPVTLVGGGTIDLGSASSNRIESLATGDRLTNEDNVIRGAGSLGVNAMSITNRGLFEAGDRLSSMMIDPPTAGDFVNEGTVQVQAGGLVVSAGRFENRGLLEIPAGTAASKQTDALVQTDGETAVDGTLTMLTTSVFSVEGGVLRGSGVIDGDVDVVAAGRVTPGADGASGVLTINGEYAASGGGMLWIDVDGPSPSGADRLDVETAILGGRVDVSIADGFTPAIGDRYVILTSVNPIVGTFDLPDCTGYVVDYFSDRVEIEIVASIARGDVTCDGSVDLDDLLSVLATFGPCPAPPTTCPADIDGSGAVDFADLLAVLNDWTF